MIDNKSGVDADERKRELGIAETPDAIDAMRNKAGQRIAAKRELLGRIRARALASGNDPIPGYF